MGCASDPRFVRQETPPENFRVGKAFVSLDVHEYANRIFAQGRQYDTVATFTNVGVGRNPMYFPADAWAIVSTPRRDPRQGDHVLTIEAGTYRLTCLQLENELTYFGLDTSPVEFTVRPGEFAYLGALEWQKVKTSGFIAYNKSFRFDFTVIDDLDSHRDALQQAATLLPADPPIQSQLMTVRVASVDTQEHRPSLW